METLVTPEEGLLHVRKIVQMYEKEYNSWYIIEQERYGGDHWEDCIEKIKQILSEVYEY
jgi:hypothetical protein